MTEQQQEKTERPVGLPDGTENEFADRTEPGRAPSGADEAVAEVRRVREQNEARVRSHSRTEVDVEVAATSPAGNEDVKPVSVRTADGKLFLNSHGEKVLDHDGVVDLQRALAAAFQAVS